MNERKYRYEKAKNTKEHIEAIYEDLTYSSKENYYTNKTLKDYLSDILSILKSNEKADELKKRRIFNKLLTKTISLDFFLYDMFCTRG